MTTVATPEIHRTHPAFVSAKLNGGLGNQLFQVANALTQSKRQGYTLILARNFFMRQRQGSSSLDYYFSTLFRSIAQYDQLESQAIYVEPPGFSYKPIGPVGPDTVFVGYYQSERYFDPKLVRHTLTFPPEIVGKLQQRFGSFAGMVAIHVRRGDYLAFADKHPPMPIGYFEQAIRRLPSSRYLVCSDDLAWCKAHFVGDAFHFADDLNDVECLCAISLCDHQIISNSTFSWWAAWLNDNPAQRVIAPQPWFGPGLSDLDTRDLLPGHWLTIDVSGLS